MHTFCLWAIAHYIIAHETLDGVQVGSRPIRPLSSIFLPRQQIDTLVADAQKFQDSEGWYGELSTRQTRHISLSRPKTDTASCWRSFATRWTICVVVVTPPSMVSVQ